VPLLCLPVPLQLAVAGDATGDAQHSEPYRNIGRMHGDAFGKLVVVG